MGGELLLRVLGPVGLERDGVQIDVGGTRQRQVLARLAVANGRPVTSEALLSDVWGPGDGDSAASLHVSVSKLRRAIDPDRQARDSSPLVSMTGGYALSLDTDADVVEAQARRASDLLAAGDLPGAHAELAEARAAWHGEPFEGVGEHSWLVLDRRRCEELRLYVTELYAETSLRLGHDAAGVVVDLARLTARHPTHERLAALLAVALYRDQRQDEALQVLRSTRDHLRDHSGLDPGPDLQRTEALILAQEPDPYAVEAQAPTLRPAERRLVAPAPGARYPLVGRGRARAVLDAAAQAAESGQPTTAVLVGEAGIGKTRLTRATVDDLASRGWRVVWSGGAETEGAPALWPWLSIVRDLRGVTPLAPELDPLVEGSGPMSAGVEPAAERWRQSQRVEALLHEVAREAPLVVVLDDLQWMDAASQALLVELASRMVGCRLLVLVTSRQGGSDGLTATLGRMARAGVIRLDLEGLTEGDVQALAAGAGLEGDVRALCERTGGNPFLLQETLAFAAESAESPLDVVPASVADVLGARMARLPAAGEEVLELASVLGSAIDPELLVRLAKLDPDLVDEGLDAALAAGLLSADPDGKLRFRHDLIRETAYGRLGAVRRSRLHARALSLLKASGPRNPSQLASHARAAGPILADETVRWSTAAAVEATARHAPDSALQWWRTAHDADRSAASADPGRRVRVLLGLVRAQLDAGDAVGAIETRAEAAHTAEDVGDPALLVAALTSFDGPLVWLPRPMGQVNTAMVRQLERVLSAIPEPPTAARCKLLATLAIESYALGAEARCDELTSEALQVAESLGDPRLIAFCLNARIVVMAFPSREGDRAQLADRLVEVAQASDLPSFELAGHQLACRLQLQLFEVRTADRHAGEARRLAEQLRLPLPAMQQGLWDCSRRALDGDFAAALRMLDTIEERDWPWWNREAMLATVRLTVLLRAGRYAETAPLLELANRVHPRIAGDAAVVLSAQTAAESALPAQLDEPARLDWTWLSGGCIHAQAALAVGQSRAISASYESLLPGSGMIASTGSFDAGPVDGYLADLAEALDRPDDVRRHRQLLAELSAREGLA